MWSTTRRVVASSSSKRSSTWFSTTSLTHLDAVHDPQRGSELAGAAAAALHQVGHARPAERAQRGVHRDATGAAGELGDQLDRVRRAALGLDQVGGVRAHRHPVRTRVPGDRDAAVVRHVQPLVRVGRPGVGGRDALDQRAAARELRRPTARTRRRRAPTRRGRAPSRSPDRAGRRRRCSRCRRRGSRWWAGRRPRPEPQRSRRARPGPARRSRRAVRSRRRTRGSAARSRRWRAARPGRRRAPAGRPAGRAPGRPTPRRPGRASGPRPDRCVGHAAAGDEADRGPRREPEQVDDPLAGHRLGGDDSRGHGQQARVLVPRGHQPVGRQRRGQRRTDHEPEEAAALHRGRAPARR